MVVKVAELPLEAPTIATYFAKMTDPRKRTLRYHKFMDIWVIGICAVICGADAYEAMADFGRAKAERCFVSDVVTHVNVVGYPPATPHTSVSCRLAK